MNEKVNIVYSAIKPCPFCGLRVELVSVKTYPNGERSPAYIKCRKCNYHIAGYEDKDVINQWNTRSAIRKEFCPNCEAETPCTHEAELVVCDICGEDFAKYIVSRNCNVSDVSMTQDVLTDIKTGQSIEKETCSWIQEDDPEICYWKTGCGNSFYFTEGTPTDNNMKYCCYCGKLLKQED